MDKKEILGLPAWKQVDLIRRKKISCHELLNYTLNNIYSKNPTLNAYCEIHEDSAKKEAEHIDNIIARDEEPGCLCGLPTAIKDIMDVKGFRNTMGSKLLKDNVSLTDDISVKRLKSEGCIILGKTNTPEMAALPVTQNYLYGRTSNPFDIQRVSGGSSGGSGVVMASGMASIATGSDGGGSIRTPAALCGLVGLKPCPGRVPSSVPDFWGGISTNGVITRTVKDSAIQLDVLTGTYFPDLSSFPPVESFEAALKNNLNRLRIGWSPTLGYATPRPEVIESCEKMLKLLEEAGHNIEILDYVMDDPWEKIEEILIAAGVTFTIQNIGGDLDDPLLTPTLKTMYTDIGRNLNAQDYINAQLQRFNLIVHLESLFNNYDIVCTPTLTTSAMKHDEDPWPEKGLTLFGDNHWKWFAYTYPFNITGLPAISVPSYRTNKGLPVGFQIIGARNQESLVLRLAFEIEELNPWHDWPI